MRSSFIFFTICVALVVSFLMTSAQSVDNLTIRIVGGNILLTWENPQGLKEGEIYRVEINTTSSMEVFTTVDTFYMTPIEAERAFYSVSIVCLLPMANLDEIVIEDFESGTVQLLSYPGQDLEPNSWSIYTGITYQNSDYSLRVTGNTWKYQIITPREVDSTSMWGVAIYTHNGFGTQAEYSGFGVGDGTNELFYTFRGSDFVNLSNWIATYHWVGDTDEWQFFYLPVGVDWTNVFGYEPEINRMFYLNNEDEATADGWICFDYICDITEDMPQAPELTVDYEVVPTVEAPGMTIYFTAQAVDPDSQTLFYHWDFGDGIESDSQNVQHAFPYMGNFSVQAEVRDESGMFDRQAIELMVPIGNSYSEITVNFTGDVMMARRYEEPGGIIPTQGANAIWIPTLGILNGGADLTFINSECPYTTDLSQPHPTKDYTFAGNPANVNAMKFAGIDGVSFANNHTTDYMEPGLIETMTVFDTIGIKRCGSGLNDYQAMQPMVHFAGGISVGTLGYCNRTGRIDNLPPFLEAGPNKAGFTWFTEWYLNQTIPQANALYDIVVVQVHCGTEYATTPDTSTGGDDWTDWMPVPLETDSTTLDLQYMALDLGADVVIAHHPHVLQGYEAYNGKLIAHSLGNFVFDQDKFETYTSMILYAQMNRDAIYRYYFRPVFIDDYIPVEAIGELGRNIIDRIADYSRALNTFVLPDYEENVAFIALSPQEISSYAMTYSAYANFPSFAPSPNIVRISYPLEIGWDGYLSSVESVIGNTNSYQIRLGREKLWLGNFENEGATLWMQNSYFVTIDSQITYEGNGALKLYNNAYQSSPVFSQLEDRLPFGGNFPYTACGRIKTINANDAYVQMNYYQSSLLSYPAISNQSVSNYVDGNMDWTYFCANLNRPPNGYYGNFTFYSSPPLDDESYVWFDEVKLIEWENSWHTMPYSVQNPNNFRFIQIKGEEIDSAKVEVIYKLTHYDMKPFLPIQ